MGILDDAIREHLDLKRKHGARESELREIESDAFGPGEQPDPFAAGELFRETAPPDASEQGTGEPAPERPPGGGEGPGEQEPTRLIEPRAAAEAPAAEPPAPPAEEPEAPPAPEPPSRPDRDLDQPGAGPGPDVSAPPPEPAFPADPSTPPEGAEGSGPPSTEPPLESKSLAELMAEDEVEPDPGAPGDSTAEREVPEPGEPPTPAPAPEPPVAEALEDLTEPAPPPEREPAREPELPEPPADEPVEPAPPPSSQVPDPPPPPPPGSEPPGRARGRVHHPTEEFISPEAGGSAESGPPSSGPLEPEGSRSAEPELEQPGPAGGEQPALYDFETDEEAAAAAGPVDEAPAGELAAPVDDFEELGPPTDEAYAEPAAEPDEEPGEPLGAEEPAYPEEPTRAPELEDEEEPPGTAPAGAVDDEDEEDVLADSPEFLERGGEEDDEDLWFEKGPPQDFDFDQD